MSFHPFLRATRALILVAALPAVAQNVDCTGVPAWSATTTYPTGAKVTYQGGLYQALVSTTNVPPSYCPPCGWWKLVGTCGGPSCTAAPSVPTGLASSGITDTAFTLSWKASTAPSGCTVTYSVLQNGVVLAKGLSGLTYAVKGLKPSTSYTFTVTASDQAGTSAPSAGLPVTTKPSTCTTAPSVPGTPVASNLTSTSVTLTWPASTAGSGCTITYAVRSGNTTLVSGLTGTTTQISGLTAGTSYVFTVVASDAAGSSNPSAPLNVTTPGACTTAPGVPTGLKTTSVQPTSVTLAWEAVTPIPGCSITYNVIQDGKTVLTVPSTTAVVAGLKAETKYVFAVSASDAAGTSNPSATLSVTTPKPTNQLPKHMLTGYWENWSSAAGALKLRDIPTEYDLICVSFGLQTGTPGEVAFAPDRAIYPTDAEFIQDIATLKARGQHVILSVGGETGNVQVASAAAAAKFSASINALMDQFGFEGVDIDLENGLNATYMAQALRSVKSGAIITMAPQTLDMQSPSREYFKLALAIKDILTVVNTQYYNSGTMLGQDGKVYAQGTEDFLTALAAIQLENGLRPDQVGLGLPSAPNAAGGGYMNPSVVNAALDCLALNLSCGSYVPPRAYPDLRGVMTWSINKDWVTGYAFAKTVSPKLRSMK